MWGTNSSLLGEKLQVWEFPPPEGGCRWRMGFVGFCISAHLTCLSVAVVCQCEAAAQLVFRCFSEEIVPQIAVDSLGRG